MLKKSNFSNFPQRAIFEPICRFLFIPYKKVLAGSYATIFFGLNLIFVENVFGNKFDFWLKFWVSNKISAKIQLTSVAYGKLFYTLKLTENFISSFVLQLQSFIKLIVSVCSLDRITNRPTDFNSDFTPTVTRHSRIRLNRLSIFWFIPNL